MDFSLSTIISIFIGLFGISIMVLIHELGHLFAARVCKIDVEVLQFGFGPSLKSWTGKHQTKYQIGLIPFGGFCRMKGQDDITSAMKKGLDRIEHCEEGSLYSVNPLKRIIAYLCGPLANMLFAFLCYSVLLSMPSVQTTFPSRIVVESDYPRLFGVYECAVGRAGLKTGDSIISINGRETPDYSTLVNLLSDSKNMSEVVFETSEGNLYTVSPIDGLFGILPFCECKVAKTFRNTAEYEAGLRKGDIIVATQSGKVTNMYDLLDQALENRYLKLKVKRGKVILDIAFASPDGTLNFTLESITSVKKGLPFFKALGLSVSECLENFKFNIRTLFGIFKGQSKAKDTVSGTISASKSIGLMAEQGFRTGLNAGLRTVFYLLASVSVSLAVANLLPITALDGGLILISFIELVTRRSFSPKTYVLFETAGLIAVFAIFLVMHFL